MKDMTTKKQAKKLYVFEGKSLAEAAKLAGVSERTIYNWSDKYGWLDQRKEYLSLFDHIEIGMVRLLSATIDKALTTFDPQDVFMVIQLRMSMGNSNNQMYAFRRHMVKHLREDETLTYAQIGKRLGISAGRAQKIYKKAIPRGTPGESLRGEVLATV